MSNHRVDKAGEIEDLMNRVREHWDEVEAKQAPPTTDGFEKQPAKLHGPAHRALNLTDAYDFNQVASQFATVEAFGRRRQKRQVLKSETAAGMQARLPPQTMFGQASLARPTKAGSKGVPQWVRQEMAYEDAIVLIEERARRAAQVGAGSLRAGETPPTAAKPNISTMAQVQAQTGLMQAAQPQASTKPVGHVDTSDNRPDRFEASGAPVEVTDPNFVYKPGDSFFESLAAGAQIVSGDGAEYLDPEATMTQVAFGRPAPSTST